MTIIDMVFILLIVITGNLLLRVIFKKSYFLHKVFIKQGEEKGRIDGYHCGYKDGAINAKMYFSVAREIPTTDWLDSHKGKRLDTREKILPEMPPTIV